MPSTVATCGDGVKKLKSERPPCWEYLLFAAALDECVSRADTHLPAAETSVEDGSAPMPDDEALHVTQALLEGIRSRCARLGELVNSDLQTALGAPGQPSDTDGLVTVASSLAQSYAGLMAIKNYSRSMKASDYFVALQGAIAKSAEGIGREVKTFPERVRTGIAGVLKAAETGGTHELKLSLLMEVDEAELSSAMKVAHDGVMQALGR